MSQIAQFRLASISQRCLSLAAWRYDVHNGRQKNNYNSHHDENFPGSTRGHLSLNSCNGFTSITYGRTNFNQSCQIETTSLLRELNNTPVKQLHENKTILVTKNEPGLTLHLKDTLFNPRDIFKDSNNLLQRILYDITTTTTTHNTLFSLLYRKIARLKEIRGFLVDKLQFSPVNIRREAKFIQIYNPFGRNNNHRFKDSHHTKSRLVSLFALLGLFNGISTGDVEGEKAKLTDEQKMKKMKPVEIVIAKGVLSMCDQDYARADELFHKALKMSQDEDNDERETLVLNLLASNYFECGDFESAEKLFIDLIKRMIARDVEPTDCAILELSLKLASIYSKNVSTHQKALKGFKFVVDSLTVKLQDILSDVEQLEVNELSDEKKDALALLGWSYDWFAKHLLAANDYYKAASMLKRALEISSKVLGPLHDQTLILLNDIGTTLAMINEYEEGKTFLQKAVEGAIESQSKELASFYVNLGLINLKLKQFNEARRYCEYSIELASKNNEHHNSSEVIKLSKHCLSEVRRLLEVDH